MSNHARSVIRKLLIKDDQKRLGAHWGAADIKLEPFFADTKWARAFFIAIPLPFLGFPR